MDRRTKAYRQAIIEENERYYEIILKENENQVIEHLKKLCEKPHK